MSRMPFTRGRVFITTLILIGHVYSHTLFSAFYINGLAQGDGTCLREPEDALTATDPVEDLSSTDLACGKLDQVSFREKVR
jgi:hypothetical protein